MALLFQTDGVQHLMRPLGRAA